MFTGSFNKKHRRNKASKTGSKTNKTYRKKKSLLEEKWAPLGATAL